MKATKFIKDAIERRMCKSANDYIILFQGRNYGDTKRTTFDAAIIMEKGTTELYAIRAWHTKEATTFKIYYDPYQAFKNMMMIN